MPTEESSGLKGGVFAPDVNNWLSRMGNFAYSNFYKNSRLV